MKKTELKLKNDVALIHRGKPTKRVLEVELTAPESSGARDATALNLALILDRSGSMADGKLEQVKAAVQQILDLLRPADSVAIVDYDDQVSITAESDSVTPGAREEMKQAVRSLRPRGMTDLGGGWLCGCERLAHHQSNGKITRALLLTDGLANQGITHPLELQQHASALFERGIATSTFGVGEGFNEHLLEGMANHGGGNFYYIESREQIPELLLQEFKDLVAVSLKSVNLELTFPAGVAFELFGDWRVEKRDDRHLVINLSDLSSGRAVNLFLSLLTPLGEGELVIHASITGMDEADKPVHLEGTLPLRYADADEVALAEEGRDQDMLKRYSSVVIGQGASQALKLEREGKFAEAGKLMDQLMLEHQDYLPPMTRERYQLIREEIRVGLDEPRRKRYQNDSYILKRHRHIDQQGEPDK